MNKMVEMRHQDQDENAKTKVPIKAFNEYWSQRGWVLVDEEVQAPKREPKTPPAPEPVKEKE